MAVALSCMPDLTHRVPSVHLADQCVLLLYCRVHCCDPQGGSAYENVGISLRAGPGARGPVVQLGNPYEIEQETDVDASPVTFRLRRLMTCAADRYGGGTCASQLSNVCNL